MEIIPTTKGKPKVCYDGFMYTKKGQSSNGSKFYWICVRRNDGCKGSLVTNSEMQGPTLGREHNHLTDLLFINLAKARATMKERASQGEKSCTVYREVVEAADACTKDFLPPASTCSRTMRNQRAKCHPREGKTVTMSCPAAEMPTTIFTANNNDENGTVDVSETSLANLARAVSAQHQY